MCTVSSNTAKPLFPPVRIVFHPDDLDVIFQSQRSSIESGKLYLGPETEQLEQLFAHLHHVRHAVAFSSASTGLQALVQATVPRGCGVIVPANTFFATAAAVLHAGCVPVFCDVDPLSLTATMQSVLDARSRAMLCGIDVRAVIVVHIGGCICPDIDEIANACRATGLVLLEDASHAHGAMRNGRFAGMWGHGAAFSFFATKVIGAGEGGIVATMNDEVAARCRVLRDHGKAESGENLHTELGFNWRLSELMCPVVRVQLGRLQDYIRVRNRAADVYDARLHRLRQRGERRIWVPERSDDELHNFYKYVVLCEPDQLDVRKLADLCRQDGLYLSGQVFNMPLHHQPIVQQLVDGTDQLKLPVADRIGQQHFCLPVYNDMLEAECHHIFDILERNIAKL